MANKASILSVAGVKCVYSIYLLKFRVDIHFILGNYKLPVMAVLL